MSQIAVEVVEDTKRPEGGHAIIRLRGLNVIPAPADYRIEPVDGLANVGETNEWPLGPQHPVETRLTESGVELVAGPDVVESPHLLPGTPVVISVPAANIEAEILWPNVTPLTRTERRPVIAVPDVIALAEAQTKRGANGSTAEPATNGSMPGQATGARMSLSALTPKVAQHQAVNGAAAAAAEAASAVAAAAASTRTPEAEPTRKSDPGKAEDGKRDTMRQRASVRRIPLQRALREGEPAASPENTTSQLRRSPSDARARVYPIQKYEPPEPTPTADKASRRLAGVAIAVAIVAALSSILGNMLRPANLPAPIQQSAVVSLPSSAPAAKSPPNPTGLYDILAVGPVSPRGIPAQGVTFAQALEHADARLHGSANERDANEGAFWLKRAISLTLSDPRSQWALTQLGSLYAEPLQGEPDYAKAKLLWEIAGGLGDPVALCFLGSLTEYGLGGTAADKAAAQRWYERAKKAGGCRQIDEALKRVKQ